MPDPDSTQRHDAPRQSEDRASAAEATSADFKGAEQVWRAAEAIRAGNLVIFPTETVYGLGADARSPRAVDAIFTLKGRPKSDPLIVHWHGAGAAAFDAALRVGIVAEARCTALQLTAARTLAASYFPGPLSMVLPLGSGVTPEVSGGTGYVALRVPAHPLAQALLAACAVPVAAPSANRFTELSPTTLQDAQASLGHPVVLGLDGGPCTLGLESTVVRVTAEGEVRLLRPGAIGREDVESLGLKCLAASVGAQEQLLAPGQTPRHYAPRTPLRKVPFGLGEGSTEVLAETLRHFPRQRVALVSVFELAAGAALRARACGAHASVAHLDLFSFTKAQSADALSVVGTNFYGCLRRIDALGYDAIVAEEAPRDGSAWSLALLDRLQRASTPA